MQFYVRIPDDGSGRLGGVRLPTRERVEEFIAGWADIYIQLLDDQGNRLNLDGTRTYRPPHLSPAITSRADWEAWKTANPPPQDAP